MMKRFIYPLGIFVLALILAFTPAAVNAAVSYLGQFNDLSVISTTIPANGDINPYGIVVIPQTKGRLTRGNVLVSNFNDSGNLQGTGITIDEISPSGVFRLFAQIDASRLPGACPGGVGLTTALGVLRSGWVIVGSLPTMDGSAGTSSAGCLIILNSRGRPVETLSGGLINGPWDLTVVDRGNHAYLFFTNVLNGTVAGSPKVVDQGTVVRIDLLLQDGRMPREISRTVIGSGFPERTDPMALVIGPTGLGLGREDILYVADSLKNRIAAIPDAIFRRTDAGMGATVSVGSALNVPLGLTIAPDGDILVANGGDGNLVETTPAGVQVAVRLVEPGGGGTLFGLAIDPRDRGVYFVDDGTNQLGLLGR